jgi:hypothetical protein
VGCGGPRTPGVSLNSCSCSRTAQEKSQRTTHGESGGTSTAKAMRGRPLETFEIQALGLYENLPMRSLDNPIGTRNFFLRRLLH